MKFYLNSFIADEAEKIRCRQIEVFLVANKSRLPNLSEKINDPILKLSFKKCSKIKKNECTNIMYQ